MTRPRLPLTLGRRFAASLLVSLALSGCASVHADSTGLSDTLAFIDAVHPDPYRFADEAALRGEVAARRTELEALAGTQVDRADASDAMSLALDAAHQALVASFHDAHMRPALRAFQPDRADGLALLPLRVEVTDDGVFVVGALEEQFVGARVESVAGVPIARLRAELEPLAIYDGLNEVARDAVMSDEFAPLTLLALGPHPTWPVELRRADGELIQTSLPGVGLGEFAAMARPVGRRVRGPGSAWPTFSILDDGTALVSLPSFGNADGEAYVARIESMVAQLTDASRIVVDLRHNEGGVRTHGAALLAHLVEVPFAQWAGIFVATREIPRRWEHAVVGAFGMSLDALTTFPGARRRGTYRVEGDPLAAQFEPRPPLLDQPVAVLVDGRTRSAANEFVLALKAARPEVLLVGEEIGETCAGHSGQLPIFFQETDSGRILLMSVARIELVEVPGCQFGHGLVPDVVVPRNADWVHERIEGGDPDLDAALDALKE